jgi:hypothetical protein
MGIPLKKLDQDRKEMRRVAWYDDKLITNEIHRWSYLTDKQLRVRLNRITVPAKMNLYYYLACIYRPHLALLCKLRAASLDVSLDNAIAELRAVYGSKL